MATEHKRGDIVTMILFSMLWHAHQDHDAEKRRDMLAAIDRRQRGEPIYWHEITDEFDLRRGCWTSSTAQGQMSA